MQDSDLRVPLADLWDDIRVPGLPVYEPTHDIAGVLFEDAWGPVEWWAMGTRRDYCLQALPDTLCLDLSRPGASDTLGRRVAAALDDRKLCDPSDGVRWYSRGRTKASGKWALRTNYNEPRFTADGLRDGRYPAYVAVPTLSDIDPTDDSRIDWGPLGQPRRVDLVALGRVAVHLCAQERRGGTDAG